MPYYVRMATATIGLLGNAVAAEIRAEMGRKDLNGVRLARKMGQSEIWVSRRIKGKVPIDLDELQEFARALEVPVYKLLPHLDSNQEPAGYLAELAA